MKVFLLEKMIIAVCAANVHWALGLIACFPIIWHLLIAQLSRKSLQIAKQVDPVIDLDELEKLCTKTDKT
jgi:hypothetical protein